MKPLLIVTFLLLFVRCLHAQSDSNSTNVPVGCLSAKNCSRNLINPIPDLANANTIKDVVRCYGKGCDATPAPGNYKDVSYGAYRGPDQDCSTPVGDGCTSDQTALFYHVYYPSENIVVYSTCKLPVVILFHGGGFVDCNGSYEDPDLKKICIAFAQRGFIAITAEYRLGTTIYVKDRYNYYTAQQMLAIWRAAQDVRGVIRSVLKRNRITGTGAEVFKIDEQNIFIGGNSAGSQAAMSAAYYTPSMLISAFPPGISNSNVLGTIIQDYYYGETSITYNIKGVLDMWGGILIPQTISTSSPEDFFFANGHTVPPTIAFCGKNDLLFPPLNPRPVKFPAEMDEGEFRTESRCLIGTGTFTVSTSTTAYGNILASKSIYEMLLREHVLTEFYFDCQMGHGLDKNCSIPGCYQSDFGIGATNTDDTYLYIVQRAATFFQAVMNNKTYTDFTTTKFVECTNYRFSKCNSTADYNDHCYTDVNYTNQDCPTSKIPQ